MATNTRSSGKRGGNSSTDSGTDRKKMKLTPEQFFGLQKMQIELKNLKLITESLEKDRHIKVLYRRINELELAIATNKFNEATAQFKKKESEQKLMREQIAIKLGVESLDKYFVDDETYELTHEDNIIQN